jgi:hypothetical protein
MFGFGNRNTSYAFLAAAVFLTAAGSEYHIYAAICGAIALLMAYLKVQELERDLDRAFRGQDEGEREKMFADEIREIRREITNLHNQCNNK